MNKPDWSKAPEWAKFLVKESCSSLYFWWEEKPYQVYDHFMFEDGEWICDKNCLVEFAGFVMDNRMEDWCEERP